MVELECILLNRSQFLSRKTVVCDTSTKAMKILNLTITKFQKSGQSSLLIIRSAKGSHWVLEKVERT
jgi:hypothetical protein